MGMFRGPSLHPSGLSFICRPLRLEIAVISGCFKNAPRVHRLDDDLDMLFGSIGMFVVKPASNVATGGTHIVESLRDCYPVAAKCGHVGGNCAPDVMNTPVRLANTLVHAIL